MEPLEARRLGADQREREFRRGMRMVAAIIGMTFLVVLGLVGLIVWAVVHFVSKAW